MASSTRPRKVEHGQFYTTTNPFTHPAFISWLAAIPSGARFLEPFAGANNIVSMVKEVRPDSTWASFDIEPAAPEVVMQDTLASFPVGYDVVITNPPYLARNSARRRGMDAAVTRMADWDDLYLFCLEQCLAHSAKVAAIIPESFIARGELTERLSFVISLNTKMFDDTEHPVCLAVFDPVASPSFDVYIGERCVGTWDEVCTRGALADHAYTIRFNDPRGNVGLVAVDGTNGPSIQFCAATQIKASEIKHTSRHRTRIDIPAMRKLSALERGIVIGIANEHLSHWRENTGDVLLSPFMGLRKDGVYRRRLDYTTAGKIIAGALDEYLNALKATA